jgi:hypothetical protein
VRKEDKLQFGMADFEMAVGYSGKDWVKLPEISRALDLEALGTQVVIESREQWFLRQLCPPPSRGLWQGIL